MQPEVKERPEPKKIIKGTAKRRKPWFGKRLVNGIFEGVDDPKGLMDYVFTDVFIPKAKDIVYDVAMSTLHSMLYRTFGGGYNPWANRPPMTSYGYQPRNSYSWSSVNSSRPPTTYPQQQTPAPSTLWNQWDFSTITLDNREEAEYVLSYICSLIEEYGDVSVNTFYEAVGIDGSFTDDKYGWKALPPDRVRVMPTRDGRWFINLPRPVLLP